ncbi:unnamed protein product [Darwinula stevensoni]|uniref:Uncharacterized protein n=1 Tax=Darwinula stevensoni TaxID=69355 RepID=A0A7R9FRY2_9CRUS|nr:unnamed protein product [Darwinula stevensoni]CAG0902339.1 unnamed protein product [Darwinula stevensoni]
MIAWSITVSVVFLASTIPTGAARSKSNLTCYQCKVEKNEECGKEYLLPCLPANQPYDVCKTSVRKTAGKQETIEKECAIGPCSLAQVGLKLDDHHCDRTREEYTCVYCCKENGCNWTSGSTGRRAGALLPMLLLLFAVGPGSDRDRTLERYENVEDTLREHRGECDIEFGSKEADELLVRTHGGA